MIHILKKYCLKHAFMLYSYMLNLVFFILDLLPHFLRDLFFKLSFKKIGKDVLIDYKTFFRYMGNIEVGNSVSINRGCELFTSANLGTKITLKDNVVLSPNVKIYSAGHDYRYLNLPDTSSDILIEDHVWVGANVIILQGVTIGAGSVVSANSVVTKDVSPYSIVAGIPAKKIKEREIFDKL